MTYLAEHFYHIYNRGNYAQQIFLGAENYRFFLTRLKKYLVEASTDLVAYCLMPNHYHLLAYLAREVDFSNILRRFTTCSVRSFNNWHRRVGYLYKGNTVSKLVDDDIYLIHLCRYIHLNLVAARLVKAPEEWEFSDDRDWIAALPDASSRISRVRGLYFPTPHGYEDFVATHAEEARVRVEEERNLFGAND